jgi:hypothetical protein
VCGGREVFARKAVDAAKTDIAYEGVWTGIEEIVMVEEG